MYSKRYHLILLSFFVSVLFGYLVFFPIIQQYIDLSNLYDHKRIVNISIIIVTSIIVLISRELQQKWVEIWNMIPEFIRYSLIAIIIIGFLSAILSPFPIWALLEIAQFCLLFLMILVIAVIVRNNSDFIKQILLLTCAVFAFLILFQTCFAFFKSYLSTYPDIPRVDTFIGVFSFSGIRIFNQIQTFTLPILGVVVIYAARINRLAATASLLLLFGWWLIAFVSGARGTLLATTFGITLVSFYIHRFKLNWFRVHLSTFIASGLCYFLFFYSPEITPRAITRGGSSGRFDFWITTILETLEKPLIGYGPMQSSIEGLGLHGHNYFITLAYEWGIPVAILFTIIVGFSLYKFSRQLKNDEVVLANNEYDRVFKVGLLASLIAIWIQALFEGVIIPPLSQIWITFLGGTAIGLYYIDNDNEKNLTTVKSGYNLKFILFTSSMLIIYAGCVYPSLMRFEELQESYIEQYEPNVLRPRFWQQGKIGWEDKEKNQEIINKYLNK